MFFVYNLIKKEWIRTIFKNFKMDKKSVILQLNKILSHDLFKSSKRSVSFLKYVCEQKLNGAVDQIKEYSIAVDAFGLDRNFDQQQNPRIRVEAKRLRDRLEQYYSTDGIKDNIIISLPKGSYIPEFSCKEDPSLIEEPEVRSDQSIEYLFVLDACLLKLKLGKSPNQLFNKSDYLQLDLLKQLYIRSGHKGSSDYDTQNRIDAQVLYSEYNDVSCFHAVLTDPFTDKKIASSVFPLSENMDILSDKNVLYQLVDFLILNTQSNTI